MNDVEKEAETKVIENGERLAAFVADPEVIGAIDRLKAKYFADFMAAGPDELVLVKAKVSVLEDFLVILQAKQDAAKFARVQRDRRERSQKSR